MSADFGQGTPASRMYTVTEVWPCGSVHERDARDGGVNGRDMGEDRIFILAQHIFTSNYVFVHHGAVNIAYVCK